MLRQRRRFAPAAVPTLAMLAVVALGVAAGQWQLSRAAEKRGLAEGFARGGGEAQPLPAAFEALPRYSRVSLRGRYESGRQFLLDNMTHEGRAGFHVLTPLVLEDGRAVIVNRGWIPPGPTRGWRPEIPVGEQPRELSGRLDTLPRPPIELDAPPPLGWPQLRSFPRMEQLAGALSRELHPQVLLLDAGQPDGYLRDWRPPGLPPERHLGYAVQWFALAATALVVWAFLSLRRTGEE